MANTTFAYDANGDQVAGNDLTLTYASFNKPATIARGSALIAFAHDSEQQRFKQTNPTGETLYLAGSGVMAERLLGAGGIVQWTNYFSAGGDRRSNGPSTKSGVRRTRNCGPSSSTAVADTKAAEGGRNKQSH